MGESLWADIDQKLVDIFTLHMGPESAYADLRLSYIVATVLMDQSEWDAWAAQNKLPALVIESRREIVSPGPFGDGQIHLEKEYPFILGVITEGDEAACVRDAKILLKRVELVLRTEKTLVLVGADGEKVRRMHIQNATVHRAPRLSDELKWFGIGAQELTVEAIV